MKSLEMTGKTVDAAVNKALLELGATLEEAEIEVLEDGAKGIFGLGSKDARVRVSVPEKGCAEKAKAFVSMIMDKMGLEATVTAEETEDSVNLEIEGENMGLVIGRRGDTLDAISYLPTLVANKGQEKHSRIVIDTENYREKRKATLENLARRMATTAVKQRRNVSLEPMNPYERRIVHEALQGNDEVNTFSVGDDPYRKVVISPKRVRRSTYADEE